jgi:hypothetical protein
MPKSVKEFPIVLGFRATEADAQKLSELARITCRGQGDVLRLLLRQAVFAEAPDIQLQHSFRQGDDVREPFQGTTEHGQ